MRLLCEILAVCFAIYEAKGRQCYECNIYEDQQNTSCAVVECPAGYNVCTTTTYLPKPTEGEVSDCYHAFENGTSYRGDWHTTIHSQECLAWDENANFTYKPEHFSDRGIGSHNHCRNPDSDLMPWCYISMNSDFAFCSVPQCFPHLIKVQERSCGWLNKRYCKNYGIGERCREVCESDLCNEPSGAHNTMRQAKHKNDVSENSEQSGRSHGSAPQSSRHSSGKKGGPENGGQAARSFGFLSAIFVPILSLLWI